jgi:hypothetical protein
MARPARDNQRIQNRKMKLACIREVFLLPYKYQFTQKKNKKNKKERLGIN